MSERPKITIKYKTPSGHIDEFDVGEILEIDGRPYRSGTDFDGILVDVARLDGRVQALENLLPQILKGN